MHLKDLVDMVRFGEYSMCFGFGFRRFVVSVIVFCGGFCIIILKNISLVVI